MICTHCQHTNRDGARFCARCGEPLQGAAQAAPAVAAPGPAPAGGALPPGVPPPAAAVHHDAMRGYHPGGVAAQKKYADGKNSFIATFVSFIFPAGGQLYNGDFKKAGALWLGYVVLALVGGAFTAGTALIGGFVPGLIALGMWLWAIIDAYSVAKRQKPLW
jgi:hypothetical protein